MNIIFSVIFIFSTATLLIFNPEEFLTALSSGGEVALSLLVKLTVIYAIWLAFFKVLEDSKLNEKVAKILSPINKFLFGDISQEANSAISLSLSANLLGMGGATTAMGIKSVGLLEKDKHYNACCMIFVINATSIQLLPSSVITLRSQLGSDCPTDIILPTFLSTVVSTIIGVLLVKIFTKKGNNNG